MKGLGESIPGYKLREIIKEVDLDENGTVEFNEFLEVRSISFENRKWKRSCVFCRYKMRKFLLFAKVLNY